MRVLASIVMAASLMVLASAACSSPTSPDGGGKVSTTTQAQGRLTGAVTIGPNCPGPETATPCPTPPSAYAARKVLVYSEDRSTLLATVDIDSQGSYAIDLAPARYLIELKPNGADRTSDLPKVVDILANTVTHLDLTIDTGLR